MNPPTRTPPINKWRTNFNEKGNSKLPNKHFYPNFYQNHGVRCDYFVAEEEKEMLMMMGFMVSQRSCVDLIQNCDLPPPLKLFSGKKESIITTDLSMQNSTPILISQTKDDEIDRYEDLGLLKALRLSQTRAREAEKKASLISIEKDRVSAMFFEESSRSFAHRQWVKLLEIEIERLSSKLKDSHLHEEKWLQMEGEVDDLGSSNWLIALALCLGIASVGFALGCRYLL